MSPERLEALREQAKRSMSFDGHRALASELFAEIDRLTAELTQVTGERDDALTTIRALVDHPADELAAEDTTAIQPCQPIGCDNGYHLAGCQFADIDTAEHSGT